MSFSGGISGRLLTMLDFWTANQVLCFNPQKSPPPCFPTCPDFISFEGGPRRSSWFLSDFFKTPSRKPNHWIPFFYHLLPWTRIAQHCIMFPLSNKSCFKSNKLRPILKCQFCRAISKNICLYVFGSKQPREILVFLWFSISNFDILSKIFSV